MTKSQENRYAYSLNIFGAIIVVILHVLINLLLSPYIVEHLGVEMNGFITLANNFVSYCTLATVALNSMSGRFILLNVRKGDMKTANEYYSSVFIGDYILGGILLIPCVCFLIWIDSFINISTHQTGEVRLLFALVFLNFFLPLFMPKWSIATYVANKLYLRSVKNVCSAVLRAVCIFLLFFLLEPAAYFVAVAGLVMTFVNTAFEFGYKRHLMPDLRVAVGDFKWNRIWELIASGVWNFVNKCGGILLEGLDLLIANIFIDPIAMGVLSLSKTVPNMMNQVLGNVSTTFGPQLVNCIAENDFPKAEQAIKKNMRVLSLLTTVPIGVTLIFGKDFFSLWVPSQNAAGLMVLTALTLTGILITGITHGITTLFGAMNKLRLNSLVVILSGLMNIAVVSVLLKTTDLGIFAIAGVSSSMVILREFVFTAPYAAKCLRLKWFAFLPDVLKGAAMVVIPLAVSLLIKLVLPSGSWLLFFMGAGISAVVSLLIEVFLVLKKEERQALLGKVRGKLFRRKGQ